ncbi:MAG: type II toxin-antitoxin system VapC family toxin [Burkholderiales bacterium]|nr:type II toxin-antitoxin system VapC family toxin [Anaerolineae bacterium]
MGVKAFVDTNVLLRALLTDIEFHTEADALLKRMWSEDVELWISGQVIREFIVQATHPKTLKVPLTREEVIAEVRAIKPLFHVADETQSEREKLLELLATYLTHGKQVHDMNIVATMLANDIDTLLTLNIDDFKRYADKITLISPLDVR